MEKTWKMKWKLGLYRNYLGHHPHLTPTPLQVVGADSFTLTTADSRSQDPAELGCCKGVIWINVRDPFILFGVWDSLYLGIQDPFFFLG